MAMIPTASRSIRNGVLPATSGSFVNHSFSNASVFAGVVAQNHFTPGMRLRAVRSSSYFTGSYSLATQTHQRPMAVNAITVPAATGLFDLRVYPVAPAGRVFPLPATERDLSDT